MKKLILPMAILGSLIIAPRLYSKEASTITLFVNPAQKNINFKSPKSMFFSFGKSYLKQYMGQKFLHLHKGGMGHAVARIDCEDTKGERQSFFAGLSGQYSTEQDKIDLLEDQLGLGVLFREYSDGYIQASSYVRLLIGDHTGRIIRDGKGKIKRMTPKFMSFEVTPEQCESAVDYYKTFKAKRYLEPPKREEYITMAPNEPLYFSFNYDPYEVYRNIKDNRIDVADARMGGGCSSFASGFLKAAGVFDPIFEKLWRVNLSVGESYIGGPESGQKVSVGKIVMANSWSKPGDRIKKLGFYHPENIWAFFEGAEDCRAMHFKSRFCTPEIRSWLASKKGKVSSVEQKIKYTLEKKKKGEVNKVRYLPGLKISL